MLLADSHVMMFLGVDIRATTAPYFNLTYPYIGMAKMCNDDGIFMTASLGKSKASLLYKRNGRIEASKTRIT